MSDIDHANVIKAQLLGDYAEAEALIEDFAGGHGPYKVALTAAVFTLALRSRFGADSSREAIDQLITEARAEYVNAPGFKPLAAEALVRGVLSEREEHLLDEVPVDDYVVHQLAIAHKIVTDSGDLTARIDDVITEAKELVARAC
ncbi:MAG TPA: hypothetical protein H9902_13180 [Candidatus Stackebrandtia faecavium]|nr:hypothetical protein [Candidatus Stackebrandtia faecavium]